MSLPNTPLTNPLDDSQRQAVKVVLAAVRDDFAADLQDGYPPDIEIPETQWRQRVEELIADLGASADAIINDTVGFDEVATARNILQAADEDNLTLKVCLALLEQVLEQTMPQRRQQIREHAERMRQEQDFLVQYVFGRGEPLATPPFAYTVGLTEKGHPELALVALDDRLSGMILNALGEAAVDGAHLEAGQRLEGLIGNDLSLQVLECPDPLRANLFSAYVDGDPPAALQIVWPDAQGRFPGEPGFDPEMDGMQVMPDHLQP
jgi:hypothetical protein